MGHLDNMGMSSLAMMNMAEQYPWMKEKKPVKKSPFPGILHFDLICHMHHSEKLMKIFRFFYPLRDYANIK